MVVVMAGSTETNEIPWCMDVYPLRRRRSSLSLWANMMHLQRCRSAAYGTCVYHRRR